MTQKKFISTDKAPSAIGPYSQAVTAGNTTYISGQIPINPETSKVETNDFAEQADQVFKNIQAVTEAAGGSLKDIVKLNLYLTDLNNFSIVNDVMMQYFSAPFPARAAVGISQLPMGVQVEAEAIMII